MLKLYTDMTMDEDVSKVQFRLLCKYKQYELKRSNHLNGQLTYCLDNIQEKMTNCEEIEDVIDAIQHVIKKHRIFQK